MLHGSTPVNVNRMCDATWRKVSLFVLKGNSWFSLVCRISSHWPRLPFQFQGQKCVSAAEEHVPNPILYFLLVAIHCSFLKWIFESVLCACSLKPCLNNARSYWLQLFVNHTLLLVKTFSSLCVCVCVWDQLHISIPKKKCLLEGTSDVNIFTSSIFEGGFMWIQMYLKRNVHLRTATCITVVIKIRQ